MAPPLTRILAASLAAAALVRGALVELPTPATGPDGAFTDCPCIDHTGNKSVWAERLRAQGRVTADGDLRTPMGVVPRDYGSGECLAFDALGRGGPYSACAEPKPRAWCVARWCYVDPAACAPSRMPEPSQVLPGLHYSYAACGSISHYRYSSGSMADALAPLHVFAFGSSVFEGPRPGMEQLEVVITEFMGDVLHYLGFTAKQVPHIGVSAGSRAAYNSSYTACVNDIAVGNLDLCVGAFWDTFDRRELIVPFASTLLSENVYLYVPMENIDQDFWSMVLKPTRAFSPALWGLIVAVLLGSGLVMAALEHGVAEGDFAESKPAGSVLRGFYLTGMSLVNAGSSFAPQTGAGKVFSLGFGFFILIAIASFTANTASILVAENKAPVVPDLADAMARDYHVCTPSGLRRSIVAVHPRMQELGVFSDKAIDNYYAGRCSLAILPEFLLRQLQSQGKLCDLRRVGDPIASFPTGVFASERLRSALDTAITAKRADGTWYLLAASLQLPARCPTGVEEESMELEVQHMTGNCMILGFSLAVAMLLRGLQSLESSRAAQSIERRVLERAAEAAEVVRSMEHQASHFSHDALEHAAHFSHGALEHAAHFSHGALEHMHVLSHGHQVAEAADHSGGAGQGAHGHSPQSKPEGELGRGAPCKEVAGEGALGHTPQPSQPRREEPGRQGGRTLTSL